MNASAILAAGLLFFLGIAIGQNLTDITGGLTDIVHRGQTVATCTWGKPKGR